MMAMSSDLELSKATSGTSYIPSLLHLNINIHFDRLRWVPVVVCVSSMGSEDKTKVAERAASLGILYSRPGV